MRGFEDSTNPVQLLLDPVVISALGLPAGQPVSIDGRVSEATDYGILTTVSGTRYFVPWGRVYLIRQLIPVAAPVVPVQAPGGSPVSGDGSAK